MHACTCRRIYIYIYIYIMRIGFNCIKLFENQSYVTRYVPVKFDIIYYLHIREHLSIRR